MMTTEPRSASAFAGLSVRTRITVAVALLTGLALSGAGLLVFALESARIENEVADQVEQELQEFSRLEQEGKDPATTEPFDDVSQLIDLFLSRNVPDDDELLVGYWDDAPRVRSGRHLGLVNSTEFREIVASRLGPGGSELMHDPTFGEVLVTVQPVRNNTTSGALVIANFVRDERDELNRVMRTYAIVGALSLGLITAVAAWQAGRLLAPLRTLRETAQSITESDLSQRIPAKPGNDDITALTRTVNEMLDRLDSAFTGQRQFLDDAGHELKTPLTILQGHLELVDTANQEEVEATRELLLDEVDRMSRLVNDLTLLAKTDRPDFFTFEPVNIAPFTETVLDKVRGLAPRDWKVDESAHFMATIDPQRITQALVQLAQNAVKHTREGDQIAIGSSIDSRRGLRLWVRDTGAGVRDEDKEHIFERFARSVVPSGDEGFGLGLSIVRAIATAHGGAVHVEDAVPPGARFVLTLPVRRTEDSWHAS